MYGRSLDPVSSVVFKIVIAVDAAATVNAMTIAAPARLHLTGPLKHDEFDFGFRNASSTLLSSYDRFEVHISINALRLSGLVKRRCAFGCIFAGMKSGVKYMSVEIKHVIVHAGPAQDVAEEAQNIFLRLYIIEKDAPYFLLILAKFGRSVTASISSFFNRR